jgi:nucleotide-binding universal stress UspA family protein
MVVKNQRFNGKGRKSMENPPAFLGKKLMIAMDSTPDSLATVRAVARHLPDPAHTEITLMHYLAPIFWEYGGDSPETARFPAEEVRKQEMEEEALTVQRFSQAQAILQDAGVTADHIHRRENWSAHNVADAILSELKHGAYSTVVIGRGHHNILTRLLHVDLAGVLRRHAKGVAVWVVDIPQRQTTTRVQ